MRKIRISRKRSFIGCILVAQVICDGETIGSLRSGQTTEMEITENKHIIYCIVDAPGEYGGSRRITSDVINIPESTSDINMLLSVGFTLKLTLI